MRSRRPQWGWRCPAGGVRRGGAGWRGGVGWAPLGLWHALHCRDGACSGELGRCDPHPPHTHTHPHPWGSSTPPPLPPGPPHTDTSGGGYPWLGAGRPSLQSAVSGCWGMGDGETLLLVAGRGMGAGGVVTRVCAAGAPPRARPASLHPALLSFRLPSSSRPGGTLNSLVLTISPDSLILAPLSLSSLQVDGCGAELVDGKMYYRRYHICHTHCHAPAMIRHGQRVRFCQVCAAARTAPHGPGPGPCLCASSAHPTAPSRLVCPPPLPPRPLNPKTTKP